VPAVVAASIGLDWQALPIIKPPHLLFIDHLIDERSAKVTSFTISRACV
jgi:hypothetical protein